MDFDEYEYLEKTVENFEFTKDANGLGVKGASTLSKRRSDEDGHRHEDRSKRPRAVEDESERRERSERGRVERDRGFQNERERDRERSERHRDRGDRERDRDRPDRDYRDRERKERERSIRDKDKEHDKEREKDIVRSGSRDRSHSRSRDFPDRERDKENNRIRERDFRPWVGERDEIEREPRPPREKKEKKEEPPAEPEADPERDQRTVFAFQISLKADERDVYEFFSRAGKVRDVRLIMDRNSRRSKGVGYIEFYDAMSVPMAIALTGQPLLGQPVMVKPSEAEKNLVQSTASAATGAGGFLGPYSGGARRLYVGNLHYNISEDQLRQVFEPFGPVELVQLPTEPETGQCKGYGFVQYARLEDARSAQQAMNGTLELAGRVIKVVAITDQMSMQDAGVAPGELDDDEGGGLSLTARSRALLMQKLDRSGTVSSIAATPAPVSPALNLLSSVPGATGVSPLVAGAALGPVGLPGMVGGLPNPGLGTTALGSNVMEPIGAPTDCLLLKNMFDPKAETEPDFDLDIKDEVQSECSKFGIVKHIFVDKHSAGHVYIRFDNLNATMSAQRALHGRWFAGKMISTTFLTPRAYETKFPESKQ